MGRDPNIPLPTLSKAALRGLFDAMDQKGNGDSLDARMMCFVCRRTVEESVIDDDVMGEVLNDSFE